MRKKKRFCLFSLLISLVSGLLVAALYIDKVSEANQGWHRAIIMDLRDMSHAYVFYVDYGTKGLISLKFCRFLHRKFSKLPYQVG